MISNKQSGANFERLVVRKLNASRRIFAERAYASDGRSLGLHPEVDVVAKSGDCWRLQCKHRRNISDYIKPSDNVDAQVLGDRSGQYVVMSLEKFIQLLDSLPQLHVVLPYTESELY